MADVKFTVTINKTTGTITIKNNGTDFTSLGGNPSTITVYIKTENKNSYVYRYQATNEGDILAFMNSSVGLVLTPDIFVVNIPDNFYIVEVIANEGEENQMLSERQVFTQTDALTKLIESNALSVNFPPRKTIDSVPFAMALQLVELLLLLSDSATYTYERENKWRILFNAITIAIDEYKY